MLNFREAVTFAAPVSAALFVGATAFMPPSVYSSWWWTAVWASVWLVIVFVITVRRLWRRPAVFAFHLSFLLILAGGGLTSLTAVRGTLHLSAGETSAMIRGSDGRGISLPFGVTLESFEPEYYAGMEFPRDYRSRIVVSDGRRYDISMNNIGRVDGWRFYQTSYDGRGGTVLTVSHDPAGIAVTYAGYALFAIAGAWMLLSRRRAAVAAAVALALSSSAAPTVTDSVAAALEGQTVLFRGRAVPFGEMADMTARKLAGRSAGVAAATRFVASLQQWPQEWAEEKILYVGRGALADSLGAVDGYVAPAQLYADEGDYIPSRFFGVQPALDSEIMKLDERMALLIELWQDELYRPAAEALPRHEVASHLLWTWLKPWSRYFILIFVAAAGVLLFRRVWIPLAAGIAGAVVFVWQWSVGGHVPLAGTADVALFASVVMCFVAGLLLRQSRLSGFLSLLLAGSVGLVGHLAGREPVLTPLMPVLSSPWLALHVSLVMCAYALLGCTLAVSVAAFVMPGKRRELQSVSMRLLAPGTYVLGLGIIAGAMWANVSWGRYWAWDPKETWALVTLMLYAVALHPGCGLQRSPLRFHVYVAAASLSILMTYIGVNYLPSLHAYA